MNFINILDGPGFRFIIILITSLLLLVKQTWVSIVGGVIAFSYFTIFIVSSFSINKERLYNSLIYRGYIKNSEENKNKIWISFDQLSLSVLYLSIYFGLYILKIDPNLINSKLWISLGMMIISLFAKFLIPPLLIDSSWRVPSFNTIQSYIYSVIVLIVSLIYYLSQINNMSQSVVLQNIFTILIVLTTVYLVLSPLVNHYNYVECKYFNEEYCKNKETCVYTGGRCLDLSPTPSGGPPSGDPTSSSSPPPCSSYNDESSCNSGDNCYYVKNIDDISDLTQEQLTDLTVCINTDEKCIGRYESSCSATFEPTNRFKECCYDTIFDSNCIESEMISRMNNDRTINIRKDENEKRDGRVGDYSLKSGEKQIEYEAIKGYCSEIYERKDIEDGIYA